MHLRPLRINFCIFLVTMRNDIDFCKVGEHVSHLMNYYHARQPSAIATSSEEMSGAPTQKSAAEGMERVKKGLQAMLKGGVIMDVMNPEKATIAEAVGACAIMALERIPADIRNRKASRACPTRRSSRISPVDWKSEQIHNSCETTVCSAHIFSQLHVDKTVAF